MMSVILKISNDYHFHCDSEAVHVVIDTGKNELIYKARWR